MISYLHNFTSASLGDQIEVIATYTLLFIVAPATLAVSCWRDGHPRRKR